MVMDMLVWESYLSPHIIFDDLSDLSEVSNLNSKALVWYHLLISNFMQKTRIWLLWYFLLLINSNLKINIPQIVFEYLKMTHTSFQEGNSCSIPYGRVLSELFIQQGVEITMTGVKSKVWGDKPKLTKALKNVDPFKVKVVSMDESSSST